MTCNLSGRAGSSHSWRYGIRWPLNRRSAKANAAQQMPEHVEAAPWPFVGVAPAAFAALREVAAAGLTTEERTSGLGQAAQSGSLSKKSKFLHARTKFPANREINREFC
jgi:hypothetical protein